MMSREVFYRMAFQILNNNTLDGIMKWEEDLESLCHILDKRKKELKKLNEEEAPDA